MKYCDRYIYGVVDKTHGEYVNNWVNLINLFVSFFNFCIILYYRSILFSFVQVCDKKNIQFVDFFREKIIQTYEMMIVRHG